MIRRLIILQLQNQVILGRRQLTIKRLAAVEKSKKEKIRDYEASGAIQGWSTTYVDA